MSGLECEIGPCAVRVPAGTAHPDPGLAQAALAGGEDPLTLVGDRPVAVAEAWRALLQPVLDGASRVVLIHPSWWSRRLVETVLAAAAGPGRDVTASARAAAARPGQTWVEIAPHLVLVVAGATRTAVSRRMRTPQTVAEAVAQAVAQVVEGAASGARVSVDAPAGVPGCDALAALIDERLLRGGVACRRVTAVGGAEPVQNPPPARPAARVRRRGAPAATAVGAVLAVALGLPALAGRGEADPEMVALVEGRVALEIPADWAVQRVTEGPGSARLQAGPRQEGTATLHVTQSRVPAETPAATAAVLRRAMLAEPAGVFVDFRPDDVVAGRRVVTYREIRPGHQIRWAVFVDGGVRIGIGCAAGPTGEPAAEWACRRAVRSAHEIG
ncbi:type VII secretion-associated protein [Mycolicibacterium palauense]|uniref:type VII secretion-associated protein n=1 Tax=Mycolicibacterium palauense TaxID=2034511 RepID=UPI00159BE207|nr:type VII secretion-associated protein [Mycolicibacterium palauense]